jgi:LuxR family maltose regulon positive regulatory protein
MRGREDVPGFVRAFAGDNRYIVDYLVEEVLQLQPEVSGASFCRPPFSTG